MMILDPNQVNYQLVADLICSDVLFQMRGGNHGPPGGYGGGPQGRFRGGFGGQGGPGGRGGHGWQGQQQPQWQAQQQEDNWMQMQMMQQQMAAHQQMQQGMQAMGLAQASMHNGQNMPNPGMLPPGIMPGMQAMQAMQVCWCRLGCVDFTSEDGVDEFGGRIWW